EGAFGAGLEAGRAWGDTILQMDRMITDDWTQAKKFMDDGALPVGVEKMYTEIGQVINREAPARKDLSEKIIACNIGISASDVAIGKVIYELALKKEIGIKLPLMEEIGIL